MPDADGAAVETALLWDVSEPVATVLIDWSGEFALDSNEPAPTLLKKILAATSHDPKGFRIVLNPADAPDDGSQILWFTQRPVRCSGVLLPSLAAMLADPGLKRVAWQHLKQWMAKQA